MVNGNTVRSNFQVDLIERITIPDNCYITLPEYTLFSISQLPTTTTLEAFRWGIHFDNLIPSLGGDTIHKIVAMFDNMTSMMPPLDPFLYSSMHADMVQMKQTHFTEEWHFPTSIGIACGALLMAVVIAGVVVCAGVYKRRQAAAATAEALTRQENVRMSYLDKIMQQPLISAPDAIPMPRQRCTSSDVRHQ